MRVCPYQSRLSAGGDVIQTKHTIYWNSKFLVPDVCLLNWLKPVYGPFGQSSMRFTLTAHLNFVHASQKGIKCTKTKKYLRSCLFVCTAQYHGSLRSRESGQAPMLQVFLTPGQALSSHPHQQTVLPKCQVLRAYCHNIYNVTTSQEHFSFPWYLAKDLRTLLSFRQDF